MEMHFSDMKFPHLQFFTSVWGVVSAVLPYYCYVTHNLIDLTTTQLSGWLHCHLGLDCLLVTELLSGEITKFGLIPKYCSVSHWH